MCVGSRPLKPMREGAKITTPPHTHESKRVLLSACDLIGPGLPRPYVHEACTCNELVSLRNRVLAAVPPITCNLTPYKRTFAWIGRQISHVAERCSYEKAVSKMEPQKRERYLREVPGLELGGLNPKDSRISAFTKWERLPEWDKDPRMIQFRSPKYSMELATYLKPIEHALYDLHGDGVVLPKGRLVAKGRNALERAADIWEKFNSLKRAVVFSLDCSRFDMHVQQDHLRLEHLTYNVAYRDRYLAKILRWQLVNRGKTANGINYTCPGGRMSGDMNTALGNCVLMIGFVGTMLSGQRYEIYDDGDDCLLMCEAEDEARIQAALADGFQRLGFVLKFENRALEFEGIRFCQCAPVNVDGQWNMVRDPRKILGFGIMGTKLLNNGPGSIRTYLRTVAQCGLAMYAGVPVLQAYYVRMRELGAGGRVAPHAISFLGGFYRMATDFGKKDVSGALDVPVRPSTRESFSRAWGMGIQEQHDLEELVQGMMFPSFTNLEREDLTRGTPESDFYELAE